MLNKPVKLQNVKTARSKKVMFNNIIYDVPHYNSIHEAFLKTCKLWGVEVISDKNDTSVVSIVSTWDVESEYLNMDRIYFTAEGSLLHRMKFSELDDEQFGKLNVIEYKHKLIPYLKDVRQELMQGTYDVSDIEGSANLLNRIYCERSKVLFSMDYVDLFNIYSDSIGATHLHFWDLFISQKIWGIEFTIKNSKRLVDIDYFDTWFNFINVIYKIEEEQRRSFSASYNNSRALREFFMYLVEKYKLKEGATFELPDGFWLLSPYMLNRREEKFDIFEFIKRFENDISSLYSESKSFHTLRIEFHTLWDQRNSYSLPESSEFLLEKFGKYPDPKFKAIPNGRYWPKRLGYPTEEGSAAYYFHDKHNLGGFEFRDQCGLVSGIWFDSFFGSLANDSEAWYTGNGDTGFIPEYTFMTNIQGNTKEIFKEIKASRKIIDKIIDAGFERYLNGDTFKTANQLLSEIKSEMNKIYNKAKTARGVIQLENELERVNREAVKNNPLNCDRMVDFRRPGYFNAMQGSIEQHRSIYNAKISEIESKLRNANVMAYVDYIGGVSGKSFKGGLYKCGL